MLVQPYRDRLVVLLRVHPDSPRNHSIADADSYIVASPGNALDFEPPVGVGLILLASCLHKDTGDTVGNKSFVNHTALKRIICGIPLGTVRWNIRRCVCFRGIWGRRGIGTRRRPCLYTVEQDVGEVNGNTYHEDRT
ncbi:MAG: hypothetical protein BWX80_04071 [Candidatus Hydrogenedentes bacterium ADurb.Bin101]|nr:MAG: hypothetical protein BWX80_04071 [Candidatus Hydrogenedentes bacterium ADurb.Bin101]